jgi:hypothetical protein
MNSFSKRTFRKISFNPPIIVRYLPREVSILRQLSCPRISNGSGKPRKRYCTIFSTVDFFIELHMRTRAANLLILVKNSCKPGRMKTAFGPTMVGTVGEWIPYFTSFMKSIPLVAAFSMQWHSIPFMSRTIFSHFRGLVDTTEDTPFGTYSSKTKELTW